MPGSVREGSVHVREGSERRQCVRGQRVKGQCERRQQQVFNKKV